MKIIVQKFGGTSLASKEARRIAADKIKASCLEGYKVAVVLSAMGRRGDEFSTDTLLDNIREKLPGASLAERDLTAICGEMYSCAVMSAELEKMGLKADVATGFDLPVITDGVYGGARIKSIGVAYILNSFKTYDVALIAGFQGMTLKGLATTLGRGGSDTTAAALGAALKAEKVEIYTDVEGVMTADPKITASARVAPSLDYCEMGEMASEGAKVLHTRSVEIAEKHKLCLFVKNTFSDAGGTEISNVSLPRRSPISGFIHKTGIVDFFVDYSLVNNVPKRQRGLFRALSEFGISLDVINIHKRKIYFTVDAKDYEKTKSFLVNTAMKFCERHGLAKISCAGLGMKGTPGVMAAIARVLWNSGVKIYRSVDSFINISCLIDEKDLSSAISSLHSLMPDLKRD